MSHATEQLKGEPAIFVTLIEFLGRQMKEDDFSWSSCYFQRTTHEIISVIMGRYGQSISYSPFRLIVNNTQGRKRVDEAKRYTTL